DHLRQARSALDEAGFAIPLLAKEFVLDAVQIDHARHHGADAVLLIARIVSRDDLVWLAQYAWSVGVEPLIEIVDESELDTALAAGARLIGVNARDLDTLAMDGDRAARVLSRIPADVVSIHLSGIRDAEDVRRVAQSSAHGALVGESLMKQDVP